MNGIENNFCLLIYLLMLNKEYFYHNIRISLFTIESMRPSNLGLLIIEIASFEPETVSFLSHFLNYFLIDYSVAINAISIIFFNVYSHDR